MPRLPPSHNAMWAAKELQDRFKKITGVEMPVRYDDEKIEGSPIKLSVGDPALSRAAGLDKYHHSRRGSQAGMKTVRLASF